MACLNARRMRFFTLAMTTLLAVIFARWRDASISINWSLNPEMNLPREPRSSRLVLIADASRDALRRRVAEVREHITETSAWMLAERFGEGPHRVAIVGENREQLL